MCNVSDEGTMYRNMSIKYVVIKTVVFIWILTTNCRKEPETNEMRPTAAYNMGLVFQRYTDPNRADMLKKLSIRTRVVTRW